MTSGMNKHDHEFGIRNKSYPVNTHPDAASVKRIGFSSEKTNFARIYVKRIKRIESNAVL
jgi:hypothetical protein